MDDSCQSSVVLAEEKQSLCNCIETILSALEHNPRSEKLPSALFDRLLCSLFDCNGDEHSIFTFSDFFKQKFSHTLFNVSSKDRRFLIRFLLRLFGDAALTSSNYTSEAGTFFLTSVEWAYDDTSIASSWLQTCVLLAKYNDSRSWLLSNGCITHVLSFLKHDNLYVSRNAASVVSAFLIYVTDTDTVSDLLTILLGNVFQLDSSKTATNGHKISEQCASECAKLIVDFTERLHKQSHLSPIALRTYYGITLSQDESEALFRLASQFRRLQDCCIALYCAFADSMMDPVVLATEEHVARVSLRRLKISSMLQEEPMDADWQLALKPLLNVSPTSTKLTSYVTSLAQFLESCNCSNGKDSILQVCIHFVTILQSAEETVGLACLKFLSASAKLFAKSDAFFEAISQLIGVVEASLSRKNCDRFLVELLRTSSSVLADFSPKSNGQCEKFVLLCTNVENSKIGDFSANVHFASVEAVLTMTSSFSPFVNDSDLVSALKKWALSAVLTLARCASSTTNFEDVLSAYGHSSRFNVLSMLLLDKSFSDDVDLVSKLFKTLPLESLLCLMSHSFPAIRRSVVSFVFAVAHLSVGDLNSVADKMLIDLLESSFDEPDHSVDKILNYWSSKCNHHVTQDCIYLMEICSNSTKNEKEPRKVTELERFAAALRICKDVLAFLHSPDDLPCILIGAPDGDQDNLDCEES